MTIIGNTLFRNDQQGTGSGEFQIQYHASDNRFDNNIVYAGVGGVLVYAYTNDTALPAGMNHNLYWTDAGQASWTWKDVEYTSLAAWRSGSGQDANGLFANPLFLNPAGFDLRVATGSPAINSGADPGGGIVGTLDFAGLLRIQGAAIDIGAHER